MTKTTCTNCGAVNEVPPHYIGQKLNCTHCAGEYVAQPLTASPKKSSGGQNKLLLIALVSVVALGATVAGHFAQRLDDTTRNEKVQYEEISNRLEDQEEKILSLVESLADQKIEYSDLQGNLDKEIRMRVALDQVTSEQAHAVKILTEAFHLMEKAVAQKQVELQRELVAQAQAKAKRLTEATREAKPIKARMAGLEAQWTVLREQLAFASRPVSAGFLTTAELMASHDPNAFAKAEKAHDERLRNQQRKCRVIRARVEDVIKALDWEQSKLDALYGQ